MESIKRVLHAIAFNRGLRISLVAFLCLRIWFSLLGVLGVIFIPLPIENEYLIDSGILHELTSSSVQKYLLSPWYRFDTVHYLEIAQTGYSDGGHNSAFAPLFPALTRIVNQLIPSVMGSAMVVANISAFISIWLFYVLVRNQWDDLTARKSLLWACVFPASFILFNPYTESLFIALMLATIIMIQHKKWGWAVIFTGLATLARFQGMFLSVLFFVQVIKILREKKTLIFDWGWVTPLLYASIPFIIFLCHSLWIHYYIGAPLPWQGLAQGWTQKTAFPWEGIIGNTREIFFSPLSLQDIGYTTDLITAVLIPVILICFRHKIPGEWFLLSCLFYFSSVTKININGTLTSTFRYILPIFPMFIFFGNFLIGSRRKVFGLATMLTSQVFSFFIFYMWIWLF